MGGCLVLENLVLLHLCERMGLGPLGVTGLSMGGHNASLAATNWPKPLVLVPCLSWSTASPVFTQVSLPKFILIKSGDLCSIKLQGVMSQSINWDTLETQYFADGHYRERLAKMVTIVDDAFLAGQNFAKHFNESMCELRHDINTVDDDPVPSTTAARTEPANNSFKLSEPLLEKVQSYATSVSLSHDETSELNTKMLIAQGKQQEPQSKTVAIDVLPAVPLIPGSMAGAITSAITQSTTKLMDFLTPTSPTRNQHQTIDTTKVKWWEREALQFMRGVMDECTHLKNFSIPYDTSLITAISAKDDAYVPREGCASLEDVWPGAEVKYLDAGHVSAYVLHQKLFRYTVHLLRSL